MYVRWDKSHQAVCPDLHIKDRVAEHTMQALVQSKDVLIQPDVQKQVCLDMQYTMIMHWQKV